MLYKGPGLTGRMLDGARRVMAQAVVALAQIG